MLIKRVSQFHERFYNGEDVIEELHALLKRWLINHIQRMYDTAYVAPVKAYLDSLPQSEKVSGPNDEFHRQTGHWLTRAVKSFLGSTYNNMMARSI